jgi:hypothetical protein
MLSHAHILVTKLHLSFSHAECIRVTRTANSIELVCLSCIVQGAEKTGLEVRGADHGLCIYAGHGID